MKLSEILDLNAGLEVVGNRADMPVGASYPMAVNRGRIAPFVKAFHEARTKIMEAHSEKDESGAPKIENNNYVLADIAAANAALAELGDTEEDVTLSKIKLDKLANLTIAPAILAALLPMIEE